MICDTEAYLRIWFDDIVHDKLLKQRFCCPVWCQIFVFLLLTFLASFLPLLPFLADLSLLSFVSLNSLLRLLD